MRLDTATIANLAREAGFWGDTLHTVTALAVASSGGNTHYRRTAGIPGTGEWRGLWAIDMDRLESARDYDLYDPTEAARCTRELVHEYAGFVWSPVYRAGSHLAWEPHAIAESARWGYRQPAHNETAIPAQLRGIAHASDVMGTLRATIVRAPRAEGNRWPIRTR